jgi:NAD(P)-dependent dehydrogenase (short-subunit alcohol dehydrogenase family)
MPSSFSLAGKVALVTGGGRGIGKAITTAFAEAGATVVIASRKLDNLETTARELAGRGGAVIPMSCHVGKREDLERVVRETERAAGPIDILVNNSATNIGQGPALATTDDMLLKMVEINVLAAFRLVNLVVPTMIERKQGGSIINIASISGLRPQPGGLLYSFTKAGLIMLTRSWAREFGPAGIRVNAICPGLIKTDFSEYFWKDSDRAHALLGEQPLPHLGEPHEIGGAALYLASSEASFVTGHIMVVDGGSTA